MHLVASLHPCVCLFVCLSELSCLNRLTFDLNFWHGIFDLGKAEIVGEGRRSKVKVKCPKSCFDIIVTFLEGQGQRSGSRS